MTANPEPWVSRKERMRRGRALRSAVPRSAQALWSPRSARPDPVEILRAQNRERVPALVAIRYGRMLVSPFAFFRGAAAVMAADLRGLPVSGIDIHVCGDCHLMNFGGYATPERQFVFDINDFDEAFVGPWEFDLKRLGVSIVLAGRELGLGEDRCGQAVAAAIAAYRGQTAHFAKMTELEVWHAHVEVEDVLDEIARSRREREELERGARHVERQTPEVLLGRLTRRHDRERRFVDNPPLVYHAQRQAGHARVMRGVVERYRRSLRDDVRLLLERYRLVDVAVKVVGVGSVGTRCGILLFMAGPNDALILQTKQALRSVLQAPGRRSPWPNQGQRVVACQRIMQAASDMFLGWTTFERRDYYVRQLRDMKASLELSLLTGRSFLAYAGVCGSILARAHARSGRAPEIRGYLGGSDRFDRALVRFAVAYADQTEKDYQRLRAAVRNGTIRAEKV
jgi:uncharacterized protein (DUF2252 family)